MAAQSGDRAAFEHLVELTHRDTFTLALRLTGNEEDARDVTQETYLRAFRGLPKFRGDAQFSTWLYRITANSASTHLGRRRRHRHDRASRRRRAGRHRATTSIPSSAPTPATPGTA